jgi:hypothetical protein
MTKRQQKPVATKAMMVSKPQVAVLDSTAQLMRSIAVAAADPKCNVQKMQTLKEMYLDMSDRAAKIGFDNALAQMQVELPEIDRKGRITIRRKDPKTGERTGPIEQSTAYARWEDISDVIKPILFKYSFSLSFRTGFDEAGRVKVTGILARGGHREETTMILQHDATGSKNPVQAVGSSTSYGRRYTACALLNITSRGEDDDGGPRREPQPTLSPEQHAELIKLAEEAGADLARFCAMLKVDSLVDIPALRFAEAKAQLLRKKRAKDQMATEAVSDFPGDKPMKTEPPKNEFHR